MKTPLALLLAVSVSLPSDATGALKNWDGGGDGVSWNNATNWSGDTLPVHGDEVVVDVPGTNATINYNIASTLTLRSFQCEETLSVTAGGLTLTNGTSWVSGGLTMTPDRVLTVRGAAASFTVAGSVAIDGAFLYAQNGAKLSLPTLYSYTDTSGCCGSVLEASGAGSVLDLSGLTNLTGNPSWAMTTRAIAGGRVSLNKLTRIEASVVSFYADGTNSLISLPVLATYPGTSGALSFEVRNSARIEMPLFCGAPRVGFVKRSGGDLPLSQLTVLSLLTFA